MCGITGVWKARGTGSALEALVTTMTTTLAHRGPDGAGVFVEDDVGVALGHRRLAIVDLTPDGRQPMESTSGRYVIVFNGEVYNFDTLREELRAGGHPVGRGRSDTMAMLASIEAWGLESAVGRFVGMFAFALWDRRERVLHLVRDRLGIKPLYVGRASDGLVFGSELKAVCADPAFERVVSEPAVDEYLRYGYVPSPRSIWRDALKVEPGTIVTYRAHDDRAPVVRKYWSAEKVAEAGARSPFRGDAQAAADELDRCLRDAVRLRMIADVPLGAFLSGGIDSSTVVALMQAQSRLPVRTFSIGFEDSRYDESRQASRVAAYLGTDHANLVLTPSDVLDAIPKLPAMYDEPFADSSQIPTYLVSQLARGSVTVALSGDGGDELFGGYNRHLWAPPVWRAIGGVPPFLRRGVSAGLESVGAASWDAFFERLPSVLANVRTPGLKIHKVARLFGVRSPAELYDVLCTQWPNPPVRDRRPRPARPSWTVPSDDFRHWMMLGDQLTYLPDDILVKVDRASMAVALEARVPLLDHRVVELAWSLPIEFSIQRGVGKRILRRVLERYLPRSLFERPKMGFGWPLAGWLRGPLRPWAEHHLSAERLERGKVLDVAAVRGLWGSVLAARGSHEYAVWTVLMFQAWAEANGVG